MPRGRFLKELGAIRKRIKPQDPLKELNCLLADSQKWNPRGGGLSKNQTRARVKLEAAFVRLKGFHEKRAIPGLDQSIGEAQKEYDRAIIRAIRVGLRDHPLVLHSIERYRGLEQKDLARRARSGIEKGINRVMTLEDVQVANLITNTSENYFEEYNKYLTKEQIRRRLIRRKSIPPQKAAMFRTRQGFSKAINRLGLRGYFSD